MLYSYINKNLSLRISLMVVYGLTLLTATLVVICSTTTPITKAAAL